MSAETACPIWGTPATILSEDYGFRKTYNSPRAGGKFRTLGNFQDWPIGLDDIDKAKLTTWILEQNRVGEVPLVDSKRLQDTKTIGRLTPQQRADRLLEFIESSEQHLGDLVSLPLNKSAVGDATNQALAQSECTNLDELEFLLDSLKKRGLLSGLGLIEGDEFTLTLAGHERLAELAVANQDSSQAFVAMWFHDETRAAYEDGVEPAVRTSGFRPLRIDRKETIGKIDDEIVAEIRRSRFVIADFTSEPDKPRGGVYFEAGFATGLNIPVIWMCRADLIDQVHFDTRQFSHIVWHDPNDLRTKLINRIGAVIGTGPLAGTR